MKNCARFIYDKRKYEHISQYCSNILRTTLSSFLNIRNMLIMHKVIYCKKPEYLHECLEFCKSGRTQNLVVPAINHSTTSRMFFVNAIKLWNKLPHHFTIVSNYTTFKYTIEHLYIPMLIFVYFIIFLFFKYFNFYFILFAILLFLLNESILCCKRL